MITHAQFASSRSAGSVAPKLPIFVALVLCVVALVFLTPNRDELLKRHLVDGDSEAAGQLLDREAGSDSEAISAALTTEAIRVCERDDWSDDSFAILTGFLRANKHFKAAADRVLHRAAEIPSRQRAEVLSVLAERALAEGELEFAQSIHKRLVDSDGGLTARHVREAVKTFRYNNNPGLALSTINRLEANGASLPADLRQLRVDLARESSQPGVAFALLEQRVRETSDPAALRKLIPAAVKCGVEAGRQNDLIPLYEKFLAAVPKAGAGSDPLRDEYALQLAQTHEWTSQPSRAFDVYLPLAGEGNRAALDRCLALNPGLFRTGELLDMLTASYHHYREDQSLLFLTARLLAEAARRDEAIRLFRDFLEHQPEHPEAHFRLAVIFDETQQFEEALVHFEEASRLDSENASYLAKAARTATTLGDYEQALDGYRRLCSITNDREDVEHFYNLANALGDLAAIKEGLQMLIEIEGKLAAAHRLALASIHRSTADATGAASVLEAGVKAHPDDVILRVELAESYLAQKRPGPALTAIEPVDFDEHPFAAHVALHALGLLRTTPGSESPRAGLARFGSRLVASSELQPEEVMQLAELFQANGESSRAAALFRRVIRESERPGDLARAHFHLGQAKSARTFQLEFLRDSAKPQPDDYRLLGDIYAQLNETERARAAYRQALALLKKKPFAR